MVKKIKSKHSFLHYSLWTRNPERMRYQSSFLEGVCPCKWHFEAPICFARLSNQISTFQFPVYWLGKGTIWNRTDSGKPFSTVVFASDQRFLDFGEEFRGYLISLALMQFCSLKSLILCFSTSQRSENHLVYCNLACDFLGPVFSGLGEGFHWYLIALVLTQLCSQK